MTSRVLIMGGAGMLGHKLWQVLKPRLETWVTVRGEYARYARFGLFDRAQILDRIDACRFETVEQAVGGVRPDVIVNAVGVVKQRPAQDPATSIEVNALFPHRLAAVCRAARIRLIHLSTDCVFSGKTGMYKEDSVPDADDLYGRSKLLGEVKGSQCLVLRTSMIGRELETAQGLVEWLLTQRGRRVQGYTRAIFSGFPTVVLANLVARLVTDHPTMTGLYHVSSAPISKYDVLVLMRDAYRLPVEIDPSPEVLVDRSLDSSRFGAATGFVPTPWPEMIREMAADPTPYEIWRRAYAS